MQREEEEGRAHPWWALLLGASFGILAGIWTPFWLPVFLLIYVVLLLAIAMPELLFFAGIVGFPLFHLLEGTTRWICGILLFGELLWGIKLLGGRRFFSWDAPTLFFSFLAGLYVLSGCIGFEGSVGWVDGAAYAILLLSLLPLSSMFRQKIWRQCFQWALLIGGGMVSLVGIWEYLSGRALLQWVDLTRFSDIGGRITATFANPNVLAVYLLAVLPFAFTMVLEGRERPWRRMVGAVILLLEMVALLWTWTRGAWLGAVLSVLWILMLHSDRSRAYLLLLPLPTLAACTFLPETVFRRLQSMFLKGDTSIRYRVYTWKGGIRMLWTHPYGIGVGAENFQAVFPRYAVSGTERVLHLHSLFLQVGAEVGVVGTVLLLGGVLFALMRLNAREEAWYVVNTGIAGSGALIGMLTLGCFDYIWYDRGMIFLWCIAMAFGVGTRERDRREMQIYE